MADTPASSAAQKAATTRKTNATKRSTAAKKAAETRAAKRGTTARATATRRAKSDVKATAARAETTAARKAAQAKAETKSTVGKAAEYAEKAVFVPVGATLVARDVLLETVDELRAKYNTRTKAESQLRRFERRGSTAVKGIERDAKKTRTRLERELRERRAKMERELRKVRSDISSAPVVKNAELVTARVENVVQTGRTAATKASTTVQERIASLA
jgi:hypothetical protein